MAFRFARLAGRVAGRAVRSFTNPSMKNIGMAVAAGAAGAVGSHIASKVLNRKPRRKRATTKKKY